MLFDNVYSETFDCIHIVALHEICVCQDILPEDLE